MATEVPITWNAIAKDVIRKFTTIVTDSPSATVGLVLSTFHDYGISFVWLEYRRPVEHKLPMIIHVIIGLGYAASIFVAINFDILARELSVEQICQRMPITLLFSFTVAFVVMVAGFIYRQNNS